MVTTSLGDAIQIGEIYSNVWGVWLGWNCWLGSDILFCFVGRAQFANHSYAFFKCYRCIRNENPKQWKSASKVSRGDEVGAWFPREMETTGLGSKSVFILENLTSINCKSLRLSTMNCILKTNQSKQVHLIPSRSWSHLKRAKTINALFQQVALFVDANNVITERDSKTITGPTIPNEHTLRAQISPNRLRNSRTHTWILSNLRLVWVLWCFPFFRVHRKWWRRYDPIACFTLDNLR